MPKNVKCKYCDKLKNHWCEAVIDSPDEDIVRDCRYFRHKTNADRIRTMSDEELAKYLTDKTEYQPCPGARKSWGGAYGNSYLEYHEAALDWLYWLQQPAED